MASSPIFFSITEGLCLCINPRLGNEAVHNASACVHLQAAGRGSTLTFSAFRASCSFPAASLRSSSVGLYLLWSGARSSLICAGLYSASAALQER